MQEVDRYIKITTKEFLLKLENHFEADVIFYYGEIHPSYEKNFRDFIEKLKEETPARERVTIILNTPGGSAETVEKMVEIIRFHYKEVYFIVPDYAMSAGTILCMSGDKIFMDYSSSLGPIDPQVIIHNEYVPALGYLDKVNEMLGKSADGTLTDAELLILQNLDLAQLRRHEQARDLTISLLKEWLVKYKFKNWTHHRTTNPGSQVTQRQKEERAVDIANKLGDNKRWHSHGRNIDINKLKELRIEIEDYSSDTGLRGMIRDYNDILTDYIAKNNFTIFLHNRIYF